ncbi:SPOR domain-containing protein [Parerythrobacter aurantius]|uniref:SPOR domain-containing protein n=1 Tax=Parerythrobacter aurantius TaxID=3127706 RepID=UPI003244C51A
MILARKGLLAATLLAWPAVAFADVKAGVDAWGAGDYDRAVKEWRDPAAKGDPDAQFNMAQAYRLGRGVEQNARQAEIFYAKAAAQGHIKAADNLGLLLFQGGRREEAMPYVRSAADRGDPRAQYLLGIAHFNGDLVEKDWVRAYALLTLANAAGLPQAGPAIKQMDDFIPIEQRQEAQPLAAQLKREADARLSSQLAASDLGADGRALAAAEPSLPSAASESRVTPPVRLPQPIPQVAAAPSVAAAQAALAEAGRVTGARSPADTGARAAVPAPQVAAVASPAPAVTVPAPAPTVAKAAPAAPKAAGPWKVQLGAFSVKANAERLWDQLARRPELAGATKLLFVSGNLTRLQAGGFATQAEAQSACDALKRGGQSCLVTR